MTREGVKTLPTNLVGMTSSDMAPRFEAMQMSPDIELGLAACLQQQETLSFKLNMLDSRKLGGVEDPSNLEQEDIRLRKLFREAGEGIWRLHVRRELAKPLMSLSAPWNQRNLGTALSVMELYQTFDQTSSTSQKNFQQRPKKWRQDILRYYAGIGAAGKANWCHAFGRYCWAESIEAARVVPHFFPRGRLVGSILFGSMSENLDGPQNSLLLSGHVKHWLDKHSLLIVPADPNEFPTNRWRIELIDDDIRNICLLSKGLEQETGDSLDGKELMFLNDNRPAAQFMYFRFIISMMRIRELRRQNWADVWARYGTDRPFPTLNPYIREKLLLALAGHYMATDVGALATWMKDYEFQDDWYLTPLETAEAARIVLDCTDAQEEGHTYDDDDDTDGYEPTSDTDSDTTLIA